MPRGMPQCLQHNTLHTEAATLNEQFYFYPANKSCQTKCFTIGHRGCSPHSTLHIELQLQWQLQLQPVQRPASRGSLHLLLLLLPPTASASPSRSVFKQHYCQIVTIVPWNWYATAVVPTPSPSTSPLPRPYPCPLFSSFLHAAGKFAWCGAALWTCHKSPFCLPAHICYEMCAVCLPYKLN